MNPGTKFTIHLQQLKTRLRGSAWPLTSADEEQPLRSELFSADQMEQHGRALAHTHKLASAQLPDQLLIRLAENETALVSVCRLLTAAVAAKRRITPAAEWLLDNFYLIEEQIRTAKRHLPKGYSRELPRLDDAPADLPMSSAGRPRVYDIALEIISHGDGRVDAEVLSRFVAAYQSITPLKLGELWATPIMLRLAVIENLRRVAVGLAVDRVDRNLADSWADTLTEIAESNPKNLILVIADMARSNPPMVSSFVAELARRLQGRGPSLALPLTWIEQQLSGSGQTIEQLVQMENQQQAADQVSISNSIGSLRMLGALNWREFVESLSVVDQTLKEDPSGIYARMDFATRDHYRHATERIAKKGELSEIEVARKAVDLACAAEALAGSSKRARHVGFYLIDTGLPQLEQAAAYRPAFFESMKRAAARMPLFLYLAPILLVSLLIAGSLLLMQTHTGGAVFRLAGRLPYFSYWAPGLIGVLSLLAASQLGVAVVNWLATLLVTPRPLPRMDFSEGIPPVSRTLVVIPTMLSNALGVESLVEALEVRFLANRDERLHFGLLTDFGDADQQTLPADEALVKLAHKRIDELNRKYRSGEEQTWDDIFFLFHRARRWNPQEKIWMGYERKRGKLADLNALLRDGERSNGSTNGFARIVGDISVLSNVKYVITLDTDTQLPRDAARQFVGTMAHPLNHPVYDETKQRVVEGYGILQPRVAISLPGTNRSRFARLYGGEPGIDPYTRAVSDGYQDVFGEGSFIGKGIYDVDAFEQAVGGRFPENMILSHDLLEGCYARAGLLSDVDLYEEYPARYLADVNRRYRWIRGDWQLAGWLLRHVPGLSGTTPVRQRNPLSALSQWKLFDNLRRSLVPTALTTLLILGWTLLASPWWWTASVIGILLIPALCALTLDLLRKPEEMLLSQHLAAVADSASRRFKQMVFELACLPYEAFFSLGAIARTAWRMLAAHKRMLEWNPSSEASSGSARKASQHTHSEFVMTVRTMWIAPLIAGLLAIRLFLSTPAVLLVAGPILLVWFVSPVIAWWVSRPLTRRKAVLTDEQVFFLHALSRRVWAFFETYVGADDHWLPPDNFQQYRVAAVAHRTSPTNMGLALLANVSAYDFGFIPTGQLIQRTANTLDTMNGLERYRGHFYNWYDTQALQPLLPLYVSSVDSGNLAGHLLTLRAALLALAGDRVFDVRLFDGLRVTLGILVEESASVAATPVEEQIDAFRHVLEAASAAPPDTLAAVHGIFLVLATTAAELETRIAHSVEQSVALNASTVFGTPRDGERKTLEANDWAQALARQCRAALDEFAALGDVSKISGIPTLHHLADSGNPVARDRLTTIERLAQQSGDLANVDYDFLYDRSRHLLSIGYNVVEHRADQGYYDLLASEARLCTFVAIAQGKLPQESWFAMGRLLTATGGDPVLLSWSGSMFEYLMPLLVMPTYDNTLLDQTAKAAVARQIEYGEQRGVPWGVSESGYNTVDVHFNYQYRAFGVPGLGLKRGLAEDLVVAPYASVMALMVAPEEACQNLQRLAAEGFMGRFGFFEAIDYTPARQRRGQSNSVVLSFMAHHQGMSLLALAYLLRDRPMQRRFESDPQFQAVMPLLQERIPRATALFTHTAQLSEVQSTPAVEETPIRIFNTPDTPVPEVQLLSNGRYHVMVTNAGGGYSRWKDLAVTRWREDGTSDNWGTFCYLRELPRPGSNAATSGTFWSTAYQPTLKRPESYEAVFSEGRAEFRRRDAASSVGLGVIDSTHVGYFETHTEIVVSPEDDIELRRTRITNRSRQRRVMEVTSYAEVVIASSASDALHPAFSNLFVQTEIIHDRNAILCTRRPRSPGEQAPWMLHLLTVHGVEVIAVSYETDRSRFIGRGRSRMAPRAMNEPGALSGREGSVLDPVVAIRYSLTLEPEQSAIIDLVSGMAETRESAMSLLVKYQDRHLADRVFDMAWTHSQVVLRQLNASEADAQSHARLASSILYANAGLRADPGLLIRNRRGQSGLWGYAISGDLPIVLLQIGDGANIDLVRQLVQAHAYWRLKGLAVDLVIWNEDHAGYRQRLHDQIMGLIASGIEASVIDKPGGIFVRLAEQISGEDRILFQSVARAIITDTRGTVEQQLDDRRLAEPRPPRFIASRTYRPEPSLAVDFPHPELILTNGLGGFAPDGREYVITLAPGDVTPAPWVNVLANPFFGTVVSENGSAYTWSDNAHEFRLTPWNNDPVSDAGGEALYLRDEETGRFWSPTPWPASAEATYTVRHGFGYSVFETQAGGIHTELWVYVALDAPVKFSVLKVRNESGRPRKLTATGYVEWVLGDLRAKSAMHVSTEIDAHNGALFARNAYSTEFSDRLAFFDVDDRTRTLSGDRSEFIGRNRSLSNPMAMRRTRLSGKVGAGLDPCAALQVSIDLSDGQEREIIFRLGVGVNADEAAKLVPRFRGAVAARAALEAVRKYWTQSLGAVQIETPDPSLNVLANGWLVYQTLACRLWARSGFYQSGGAFGFRDQLQDVMALIYAEPKRVREHLLLSASRQFQEGDVQHWWHPPSGRGVRTRCSDDYLWLPLAVSRYVQSTGDTGVLDESVGFLDGRPINPEDESYYDLPGHALESACLYEHCVRAIRHGLRFGEHGLPLIGSGDWNDGMNLVGIGGQGESIWLGFFLCEVLRTFADLARNHGESTFADFCLDERTRLRQNIELHGWDGEWYRRAYFDDGTPLGSAANEECRIDSISQSWSVLSGAGDPLRSKQAMKAVDEHLVRRDVALIQLLDPPFDTSALNPGYIRGYVPGVRENGGQYTHAAVWTAMAFAELGEREKAWELMSLINPLNHSKTAGEVAVYTVEPYVIAADVYAVAPHTGRGGWSWYTGSAGWTYRLIIESLLGLKRVGETLQLTPCLPADWPAFKIHYRDQETLYHITVTQTPGASEAKGRVTRLTLDGIEQSDQTIPLVSDAQAHQVEITVA